MPQNHSWKFQHKHRHSDNERLTSSYLNTTFITWNQPWGYRLFCINLVFSCSWPPSLFHSIPPCLWLLIYPLPHFIPVHSVSTHATNTLKQQKQKLKSSISNPSNPNPYLIFDRLHLHIYTLDQTAQIRCVCNLHPPILILLLDNTQTKRNPLMVSIHMIRTNMSTDITQRTIFWRLIEYNSAIHISWLTHYTNENKCFWQKILRSEIYRESNVFISIPLSKTTSKVDSPFTVVNTS